MKMKLDEYKKEKDNKKKKKRKKKEEGKIHLPNRQK